MNRQVPVSIVVPCNHNIDELNFLLKKIYIGDQIPVEIIVVNSMNIEISNQDKFKNNNFSEIQSIDVFEENNIKVIIIYVKKAYPGEARNIGISYASQNYIAFLDVKTIPTKHWLKNSFLVLKKNKGIYGVLGSRIYLSDSTFSSLVLDVIYGRKSVRSVAGTVFRKECNTILGQMVSWVPAGEDEDWINRIETHKVNFSFPNEHNIEYIGLIGKNMSFLINKWWRYYNLSRSLSINNRDRWISYILGYALIVLFAFNWNYNISELIFGSTLVVPHITKFVLFSGVIAYIFLRGFYLPLSRSVNVKNILPLRFIFLVIISSVLDAIKIVALITPVKNARNKH